MMNLIFFPTLGNFISVSFQQQALKDNIDTAVFQLFIFVQNVVI